MGMHVGRRRFLRGAGIGAGLAVGLPVLDVMLDDRGLLVTKGQAQPAAHPLSFITFFFPMGVADHGADWHPETYGDGYRPRRNLEVLFEEGIADRCLPVSGLFKSEYTDGSNTSGDAHCDGVCTFTTGRAGVTRAGASGPSIDHVIATHLGGDTRIRHLPVSLGTGRGDPGFKYASWTAERTPAEPFLEPLRLYDELFAAGPVTVTPSADVVMRDLSVLDFVKEDLRELSRRLGRNDLRRLDQHFTSIREIERELSVERPTSCEAERPGETFDDLHGGLSPDRGALLMRLMVKAFECGLTRFGSFMLTNRADGRQFTWDAEIGEYRSDDGDTGHHSFSHRDNYKLTLAVEDQLRELAVLVRLLRDVPVADRDLLHHTAIFVANEHSDGLHSVDNMPILVAGEAGGQIRQGGRAFRYDGPAAKYSRIFRNVLSWFGLDDVDFGAPEHQETREPIPGLEG